jgi:creatinine amidohydrolase
MSWPEVEAYLRAKDIALLPVGSTEQHARHAPLGTDTLIATRLAEDAAQQSGVVCVPPLPFGWSPHHMGLPGTISIDAPVLQGLVFQIVRSLAQHGFKRFILVNGHRIANLPWLQIAAEQAQRELGVRVAIFDPAYMQKEIVAELGFGRVGHAEEIETSQLMHLLPHLVHLELAVDSDPHQRPLYEVDPIYTGDTLCYVPSTLAQMEQVVCATGGSTGQPTRSEAALGQRLHEHLIKRLVEVIGNV